MKSSLFKIFIGIGLAFSPLAAIMAFLITYEEYLHHYTDKRRPFWHSLNSAIVTFITFMLIAILGGLVASSIH